MEWKKRKNKTFFMEGESPTLILLLKKGNDIN